MKKETKTETELLDELKALKRKLEEREFFERDCHRKLATLSQNEERFRLLFENIASGILFTDDNGRIIMANPQARALLGLSEAAVGQGLSDYFPAAPELISRKNTGPRQTLAINLPDGQRRYLGFANVAINQPEAGLITIFNDITKEYKAEIEMEKLSRLLNSIIDHPDIWVSALDENNHFIIWNRAAEKISGFSKEEAKDFSTIIRLIYPDLELSSEIIELSTNIYRAETFLENYEYTIYCKDGSQKIMLWDLCNIFDRNGNFRFNVAIGWDVTERKRIEDALRKSEERFRLMIENSTDVIAILNPDATPRYLSPSFERIFGYKISDVIGRDLVEFVHPDDLHIVMDTLARSGLELNTPLRLVNYRMRHRDGSWRYIETVGINLLDNPEINGFLSNSRDVTDRILAESELKRSEEKFRLLIENLSDLISILDGDGKIIYESPALEKISGYRLEELINRDAFEFVNPDDLPHVIEAFRMGLEKPELNPSAVYRIRHKNGEWRYLESKGVHLLNHPAIQGLVITSRDITEQKRLEEEKEKMQKQLLQGHKLEALGTLAGGIAHDFNNILGAIIGFTELALNESNTEARKIDLEQVLRAGNRAKQLVRQILAFSRQGKEEREPINFNQVCQEVLNLLRPTLPEHISLRQNLQAEFTMITGDATQIHQLLMNLCRNALYALQDQGGILEVRLKELEVVDGQESKPGNLLPGSYLHLTVKDTGRGIPPEFLDKIFDPYFTTKTTGEGTGLGLAVVQGIVQRHNGIIKVESEVGHGSVFHIFFPKFEDQTACETKPPATGTISRGREKILFVDDDSSLVALWRQILEKLGYRVIGETDSLKALELFNEQPWDFDLVITDQVMPDMTGMELARAMMRTRPDIRIILCTGFSEGVDAEQAQKAGIKEFVFKPLSMETMSNIIRAVLK